MKKISLCLLVVLNSTKIAQPFASLLLNLWQVTANLHKRYVYYVQRFAMPALPNVKNILIWNIAKNVPKHAANVPLNAGQ